MSYRIDYYRILTEDRIAADIAAWNAALGGVCCPDCGSPDGMGEYYPPSLARWPEQDWPARFWRLPGRDGVLYAPCDTCNPNGGDGPHGYLPMTRDEVYAAVYPRDCDCICDRGCACCRAAERRANGDGIPF